MASNPEWPDPNRNVSPSQISQRVFNNTDDAIRVDIIKGQINLEPGDISIGAVELKDADTDDRAQIRTIGNNNALLILNAIQYQKTSVNQFGSAIINPGNELTLVSYVVPAGQKFTFVGGIIGGDEAGEFKFEVGGNTIALARNSGSNRTIVLKFLEPPTAGANTVLSIVAKNIGIKPKQFECTLSGYLLPI